MPVCCARDSEARSNQRRSDRSSIAAQEHQRINRVHCALETLGAETSDRRRRGARREDSIAKELLHLIAHVAAVADAVGDPIQIDLAQKVKIWTPRNGGFFDPGRAATEVVFAVDD